jgi:alanine transaminase
MINVSTLKLNLELAKAAGTDVRAIVVINPSNPTGASLSENDVRSVLSFAAEHRLAVIADEVYQNNIYVGHFYSFKRGLRDLQAKDPELYANLEVASLNSVSKGLTGECGHRGGYFELAGFDLDVVAQIFRYASMTMCPPVIGQCLVELVVNPPVEGYPSYSLYKKERDAILDGLKSQSAALFEAFNRMEGVRCEKASGCMFLFPAIEFPPAAIKAAREEAKDPDAFYASRMLDATGVCIVPGSVYDQKSGKWHFRCSFLTPGSEWIDRIVAFHEAFMKEFGGVSLQEDL